MVADRMTDNQVRYVLVDCVDAALRWRGDARGNAYHDEAARWRTECARRGLSGVVTADELVAHRKGLS